MIINIVTNELAEFYKKENTSPPIKNYIVEQPQLNNVPINQNNKNTIHIYDIGKQPQIKNIQFYNINNHINKTGKNIIIDNKNKQTTFYDITKIYKKSKEEKIAECYGNHQPPQAKKTTNKIPCYFLCHYTIMAHIKGYKNIFAYILQ